jgi:hypothetical protein
MLRGRGGATHTLVIARLDRAIRYAAAPLHISNVSGIPDHPLSRMTTTEIVRGLDAPYAAAGIGNAVTDLIFSIANREVTFFSGTAPISFL